MFSFKSIASLVICLLMVFALLFVDWSTLLHKRKLTPRFNIWNASGDKHGRRPAVHAKHARAKVT
ncbi:MAG TPA: hypothetical protein VKG92_00380 [Flavobacteriales bacterium]|nr:hypothetical protein [Flavobacteriales bacterium]